MHLRRATMASVPSSLLPAFPRITIASDIIGFAHRCHRRSCAISRISPLKAQRDSDARSRAYATANELHGDSLVVSLSPVSYLWCKMLLKIHMIILGNEIKYPEYQFLGKSRTNVFFISRLILLIKIRR
jgi:hypothetical protein